MRFLRVLAVDCGASHVAIGRFRRGPGGTLTLERFATEALPPTDGDGAWMSAVGMALRTAGRRAGLRGPCVLGLPGHLTAARLLRLPAVAARARRQIIRFELGRWMPGAVGGLFWSDLRPAGMTDDPPTVITVVRADALDALCAEVRRAGFWPLRALPTWLALHESIRGGSAGGAMALAVGARSSHLVLGGGGRFLVRMLPLGGDLVTREIAGELGWEFDRAEALKRRVLGSAAAALVAGPEEAAVGLAFDRFVRQLGGEVARSLAAVNPGGSEWPPPEITVAGGAALPAAVPLELAKALQRPVGRREAGADSGSAAALDASRRNDLAALAACAVARSLAAVNLVRPRRRREMWLLRWRPLLAAAAALLTVGVWGIAGLCGAIAADTRGRAAALEQRLEVSRRLNGRHQDRLERLGDTNRQIASLRRIADGRSTWVRLLADLQERFVGVGDCWVERLQFLAPTAGAAATPRLRLAGCLLDPDNPVGRTGADCDRRARSLVASLGESPFVAAVEDEHFDAGRPGLLCFELTLALSPKQPF